jgi:hypothetical protein
MPSEKRRKRRRKLKDLKLLILTAFSSEYIIMEITVLFLNLTGISFDLMVTNTRLLAPLTRRQ